MGNSNTSQPKHLHEKAPQRPPNVLFSVPHPATGRPAFEVSLDGHGNPALRLFTAKGQLALYGGSEQDTGSFLQVYGPQGHVVATLYGAHDGGDVTLLTPAPDGEGYNIGAMLESRGGAGSLAVKVSPDRAGGTIRIGQTE